MKSQLARAGYGSILEAVKGQDQEGAVEADSFTASLQSFLDQGNFRLVLVLDEVSTELERIVAYLDAITVQALTLITLKVYEVNGAQIALPQRVSPDIAATPPAAHISPRYTPYRQCQTALTHARPTGETRATFDKLIEWAEGWLRTKRTS